MIDSAYVHRMFFELVQIDSPSLQERQVANRCKRELETYGFAALEDAAGQALSGTTGNLIATRLGSALKTPLLLTAHMDSVPPCLGIKPTLSEDGWVKSDGSTVLGADDKAGITAIFGALRALGQDPALPTIQVVLTIGEELGLQGSKQIKPHQLIAKEGLALDSGGSPGTLVVAGPSQARWEAMVTGRKAHAGVAPETGVSAIKVAAEAVSRMPHGRIDRQTTVNVGSFVGDGPTNIVADTAHLVGEARSQRRDILDEVLNQIHRAFQSAANEHGASVSFSSGLAYEGYRFEADHPVRQRVERAMLSIGIPPLPVERGGGSDANIFTGMGIPTVNLGVGYEDIHATTERIRLGDIEQAAQIIAAFCRQEA